MIRSKYEAEIKNEKLIRQKKNIKDNYCGLALKKTKLALNKLIKQDVKYADVLRNALELEDTNIKSKDCYGWVKNANYQHKEDLLKILIESCKKYPELIYGYQKSDVRDTDHIFYLELPITKKQISWHCNLWNIKQLVPKYEKEWETIG